MRKSDAGALRMYLRMITDGTAFDRWKELPDGSLRNRIVEDIIKGKGLHFRDAEKLRRMKRAIRHIKIDDEKALRKAIDEFLIKEEDFKV